MFLSFHPWLKEFKIRAGLSSVSAAQDDTNDQLLTDYQQVGAYDGVAVKHKAVKYLTFAYPIKAREDTFFFLF